MEGGIIAPRLTAVVKPFYYYGNWAGEWMALELELETLVAGGGERSASEQKPEEGGDDVGNDDEHENRAYNNDYYAENEQKQDYQHVGIIAQNRRFVKGRGSEFIST